MIRLLAFLALAGALAGYASWIYLRAELPVAAGRRLAALRAASLVLLAALLVDLRLPWGGVSAEAPRWVLLDVSASMGAAGAGAWEGALARARALEEEGWRIVPFGDGVVLPDGDTLVPAASRSELEPALVRAAEAGASEVRVLSDLRVHDPVAVASALATLPLAATFEPFGVPLVNAGVSEFAVRDQGRRGDPVEAEVAFFAEGGGDSLRVEIREEGTLVAAVALAPPDAGRRGRASVTLPPAQGEGRLRYTARIHRTGDAFPGDDEAAAYMNAGHEAGGLVVVSLAPDWEPRGLLTVLEEATGLDGTGYLRAGPDRFVPMGRAVDRGAPVDSAAVRAAAADAALLVLHGLGARTDAWGRSLARRGSRVILWPVDATGADLARVPAGSPLPGEWYASPEVPPSPVAADLAGARLQDLPPLAGLLPVDASAPVASPLRVQLGGTGPGRPVILLDDRGGGRRAVALASGFWRWSARDGAGRDAYRRLWSGVAGWLLADPEEGGVAEVRPARWITPAGEPVAWRLPPGGEEPLRLVILGAEGEPVADSLFPPGSAPSTAPLPPGSYGYVATAGEEAAGEGRFDVEGRTEEMLPAPMALPQATPAGMASAGPVGGGTPLRSGPWPYLLLLVLLCAEWVARRRAGLR